MIGGQTVNESRFSRGCSAHACSRPLPGPHDCNFTPWTSLEGYADLLQLIADLNLVSSVSPVQFAIRLLLPKGSLLLECPEIKERIVGFDERTQCPKWLRRDARMDELHLRVDRVVRDSAKRRVTREEAFEGILEVVSEIPDWEAGNRRTIRRYASPAQFHISLSHGFVEQSRRRSS